MLKHRFIYLSIVFSVFFMSGCERPASQQAQGYIEGNYTYIATSVSGVLKEVLIAKGMKVKQGQKLFALEEQPESDEYHAAVENLKQSKAARDAIIANLAYAKITFERNTLLVRKKVIQQSELDNARALYESLSAQLAQANANIAATEATLAQTKWKKEQKVVYAPIEGIVFDKFYRLGEYTVANQAILSLLAPTDIKVIFYVNSAALSRIKLTDKVTVQCVDCQHTYTGVISFISPSAEYTPPIIYSNETNEKLIFRIEAQFSPKEAYQLHPGQPVTVTYYSHDR